jgi:triphosphoribosyl-dephospho-CoA synthase
MNSPLHAYRQCIASSLDAVSWACALEATAPKLGNVHPSAEFEDLRWEHFAAAAGMLRAGLGRHDRVGASVRAAVENSLAVCQSNANLGIALLLAPLHTATQRCARGGWLPVPRNEQRQSLSAVLDGLDADDARHVYAAIRLANPGGLGRSPEMDVREPAAVPTDLRAAMRLAGRWDQIARAYDDGFTTIYEMVVPQLIDSIADVGDLLLAVREAQLRLLSRLPDSLIARKCGDQAAEEVRRRAAAVLGADSRRRKQLLASLDAFLRADGNRRNPGTTADLIAAGLFVLLTTHDC